MLLAAVARSDRITVRRVAAARDSPADVAGRALEDAQVRPPVLLRIDRARLEVFRETPAASSRSHGSRSHGHRQSAAPGPSR